MASHQTLSDVVKYIRDSEINLNIYPQTPTVLVLTNIGFDVSLFTKYIAGYFDHSLSSIEFQLDNIFEEPVYPKSLYDSKRNIVYYDCPLFAKSGNALLDLTAAHLTKRITDLGAPKKLILLLESEWVREEVKKEFLQLLKTIVDFLQTPRRFRDSIGLVIAVANNDNPEETLQRVKEFLSRFLRDLDNELTENDKALYKEGMSKLLQVFVDENGGPERVSVFDGNAKTIHSNEHIKILSKNLKWQEGSIDVKYDLSDEIRNVILMWTKDVDKKLTQDFENFKSETKKYFETLTNTLDDFLELKNVINNGYMILSRLLEELPISANASDTIKSILRDAQVSQVKWSLQPIRTILAEKEYLDFLSMIPNEDVKEQFEWVRPLRDVVNYLETSNSLMRFVLESYWTLSSYEVQKAKTEFFSDVENINRINILEFSKKLKTVSKNPESFPDLEYLTENHLKFLNEILHVVKDDTHIAKYNDQLRISGHFVVLSDIAKTIQTHIRDGVRNIEIFSSNTIFIDSDIDGLGKEVNLAVIAPYWSIIGNRTINLEGSEGGKQEKAKTRRNPGEDGELGAPGLPGGNGGNFFGIGMSFINGRFLKVIADGGTGGNGQDGGDGAVGKNGHEPLLYIQGPPKERLRNYKHELIQSKSLEGLTSALSPIRSNKTYRVYGFSGRKGGAGGIGGTGGKGGHPGEVRILELGLKSNVQKSTLQGKEGFNGVSGKGGVGGRNGANLIVRYYLVDPDYETNLGLSLNLPIIGIFSMMLGKSEHVWSKGILEKPQVVSAVNGSDGDYNVKNFNGTIYPEHNQGFKGLVFIINRFKKFLIDSDNPMTRSFLNALEAKDKVSDLYDIQGFLNEYQLIKGSYSKTKPEVVKHFSSMTRRLLQYLAQDETQSSEDQERNIIHTALLSETIISNTNLLTDHLLSFEKTIQNKKAVLLPDLLEYLKRELRFRAHQLEGLRQKVHNLIDTERRKIILDQFESRTLTDESVTIPVLEEFISTCNIIKVLNLIFIEVVNVADGELVSIKYKNHEIDLMETGTESFNWDSSLRNFNEQINVTKELLETILIHIEKSNKDRLLSFSDTWPIQSTLKTLRGKLKSLLGTINLDPEVVPFSLYLDEVLIKTIDLYEGIKTYLNYKTLSKGVNALKSTKSSEEIDYDLDMVSCAVEANVIKRTYENALHSIAYNSFPLGPDLFEKYSLPNTTLCDKEGLTNGVIKNLRWLSDISSARQNEDFESKSIASLYVWKNVTHQKLISKFLSGEEVNLKAEMSLTDERNARKFKNIVLQLKATNPEYSQSLKQSLKNYTAILTHWGNSYYKCGSENYLLITPIQHYISGQPEGQPSLSPYTMWSFKLTNLTESDYNNLLKYNNHVDLELVGEEEHLNEESIACFKNLPDYYKESESFYEYQNQRHYRSVPDFQKSSASRNIPFFGKLINGMYDTVYSYVSSLASPNLGCTKDHYQQENLNVDVGQFSVNVILLAPVLKHLWCKYLKRVPEKKKTLTKLTAQRKSAWNMFISNAEAVLKELDVKNILGSVRQEFNDVLEMRKEEIKALQHELADAEEVQELEKNIIAFIVDLLDDMETSTMAERKMMLPWMSNLLRVVTLLPNYEEGLSSLRMTYMTPKERVVRDHGYDGYKALVGEYNALTPIMLEGTSNQFLLI